MDRRARARAAAPLPDVVARRERRQGAAPDPVHAQDRRRSRSASRAATTATPSASCALAVGSRACTTAAPATSRGRACRTRRSRAPPRRSRRCARRSRAAGGPDNVLGFVYELVQERTGWVLPPDFLDGARRAAHRARPAADRGRDHHAHVPQRARARSCRPRSGLVPDVLAWWGGGQTGYLHTSARWFIGTPLTLVSTWDGDELSLVRQHHQLRAARHIDVAARSARGARSRARSVARRHGLGAYRVIHAGDSRARAGTQLAERGVAGAPVPERAGLGDRSRAARRARSCDEDPRAAGRQVAARVGPHPRRDRSAARSGARRRSASTCARRSAASRTATQVLAAARAHLPVLERYTAACTTSCVGIAEGAAVTPEEIVVANHYTDLRDLDPDPSTGARRRRAMIRRRRARHRRERARRRWLQRVLGRDADRARSSRRPGTCTRPRSRT